MTEMKQQAKFYSASIAQSEERKKYCEEDFLEGAKWMQEKMIDKACEWLEDNYPYYFDTDIEEQFKKAMEG